MREMPSWHLLTPEQQEALDMETHKNHRILSGDPTFKDHWEDKIGYVQRVLDYMPGGRFENSPMPGDASHSSRLDIQVVGEDKG